jgi:hypothetical protein
MVRQSKTGDSFRSHPLYIGIYIPAAGTEQNFLRIYFKETPD